MCARNFRARRLGSLASSFVLTTERRMGRSAQRDDGRIVTVYYFHDQPLGDRYIAATIWMPSEHRDG